jgi:hypothetical protein
VEFDHGTWIFCWSASRGSLNTATFAELMTGTFSRARKFVCCDTYFSPTDRDPACQAIRLVRRSDVPSGGWSGSRGLSMLVVPHRLRLPNLPISGNADVSEVLRQGVWTCRHDIKHSEHFWLGCRPVCRIVGSLQSGGASFIRIGFRIVA